MSAPGRSLARTSRSALADFVSSSSPQPIRPRSQVRTPCPPRRPSPPSRGFATWPRPSPFAGLRFAPPRASPRPPPAAPPFASTPRVRHRFPPSISPPRAAPHVPVREPSPRPPRYFTLPPASSAVVLANVARRAVPRSFAAATATRARDAPPTPTRPPSRDSRIPFERRGGPSSLPRPLPSLPPRGLDAPLSPSAPCGEAMCFPRARVPSVADPLHPPPGFEQRPRRTSR